jgi:alkylation response protein AidB-like acyl-CoA dehydrogenase
MTSTPTADPTPTPTDPYDFGPYLESLSADWYEDDPLLHELLDRYAPDADRERLIRFGPLAAGRLRALAEVSALPGNAPGLQHHDPYDHRLDAVVLPPSTLEALAIAHGQEGLGAVRGNPLVHYAMVYLLAQNGEAGVACSLACTDGLVRALTAGAGGASGASPAPAALEGVLGSSTAGYAHAAQFVTEIQGGSDVPANRVRARPDGDAWRIDGPKWFCSNINADWFLVTAKPVGSDSIGLFLVPAFVGGHRNGYTIERLKDKLGTRELATAEVTFEGARAWVVGDRERGLPLLLRYVLSPSRFACTLFAASALRRAERTITAYAHFREAFGRPIARYPLVRQTLDAVASSRREALVTCFELLRLWESAEADGYSGQDAIDFRILLSLAKPVLTRLATEQLHDAMMVLGGNGIEERFSPLPRLHRDAVIMETWEGPHNVLITQAVRDFQRFRVRPPEFLERISGRPQPELAERLELALGADGEVDPTVAVARLAPSVVRLVAGARFPSR